MKIKNNKMLQLFFNRVSGFREKRIPAKEDPERRCFRRFDHPQFP